MSKTINLSKEFLIELLNTHCFANLPEDTNFELLSDEGKAKTQFCKSLKNTSCLDYSKLCLNYLCNYEDGCCMESCEFYNHNECPVVYVNGLLGEKDKTISDLETKLAESEEIIKCLKGIKRYDIGEMLTENTKLKQQLAEKDKEVEELKRFDNLNKTFFDLFRTAFKEPDEVDDLFSLLKTMQEKHNQDKISFAVEQLEKVRKLVDELLDNCGDKQYKVWEAFENQIKQLKEGV